MYKKRDSMEVYRSWLNSLYYDAGTRNELEKIKDSREEIEDRFYRELEFGTAGLRGVIGAGTNRMNVYTVRRATQGLAAYILKQGCRAAGRGVVIAYDSRRMSREFASEAAGVLAANGVRTYLFDEIKPVPLLSFSVRELGAAAGICITASHNPSEYNGYKVYGPDGGQLSSEASAVVCAEISAIEENEEIMTVEISRALASGLLTGVAEEVEDAFFRSVRAVRVWEPKAAKAVSGGFSAEEAGARMLRIVYTPLHGTGSKPVRRILSETGFGNVFIVREQEMPDPLFSTVKYPNPEDEPVFEYALKLAAKTGADLAIATDPDCDRIGVMAADRAGTYRMLTGNQTGYLLTDFILERRKETGTLPSNAFIMTSVVTGRMAAAIAGAYGVEHVEAYTGFRFFAEKIRELDESEGGNSRYIFGFEESYGYLAGTYVRDKDAVCAAMLIAEMAEWHRRNGKTLHEALDCLYRRYGYHMEYTCSMTLKGKTGAQEIKRIMNSLRMNCPSGFGSFDAVAVKDYKSGTRRLVRDPSENASPEKLDFKKSDVIYFELEQDAWFAVRPSGTEPKIKLYFGVKAESGAKAAEQIICLRKSVSDVLDALRR